MSRKGENIYKRKDGPWEGRYLKRTPDGKTRYGYVYVHTYRDVKTRLQQAAALWETNPPRAMEDSLLLSAASARCEAIIAQQVKESTFVKYHHNITHHILPALGQICVELGFDVKCLSELLDHSTVGMTMDRYVHPSMEHKREHMQRFSGLMPTGKEMTAILTAKR